MNRRDCESIHKGLIGAFPDFVSHKRLFLIAPMRGLLRAVHFDPSAFSKEDFYVQTLILPLCVPTDYLTLNFGNRIRRPRDAASWSMDQPDLIEMLTRVIREQALPFLTRVQSAQDFATMARGFWLNPHNPKATAFVLARAGLYEQAITIIDELLPRLNLSVGWELGISEICTRLKTLILTDPDAAHRQLAAWERYTIDKLGLGRFE